MVVRVGGGAAPDARLGAEVTSGRHFDRWWKSARAADPELLTMTRERLVTGRHVPAPDDFPTVWHQGDLELTVDYRFDPGTDHDGATVLVPLVHLGRVDEAGFDWHVRGMRDDIVDALLREGVDHVFGIPGTQNLAVIDALRDTPQIRFILTRHEQGAAFMAYGFARAGMRPAVVTATEGPGLTNLATGIAAAHRGLVPVISICGVQESVVRERDSTR